MYIPYVNLMNLVYETNWLFWKAQHYVFCIYKPYLVLLQIMVSTLDQLVKFLNTLVIPCCHIITMVYELSHFFLIIVIGSVMYITYSFLMSKNLSELIGPWITWTGANPWDNHRMMKIELCVEASNFVGNNNESISHWTGSRNCHCLKKAAL